MNRQQKTKVIATRSLVMALSVALGLLFTAQLRSIPVRVANPIVPYSSLADTRTSLYEEQDQLKQEIKNLQANIQKSQKEIADINLSQDELAKLTQKRAIVGLTKLNGQGIIAIYDDSNSGNANEDSIVHAADLRDTANLLWASGAEAVSINGQRIVINTAIDCIVNTILVNNTRLSNPFRIEAIGNRDLLYERLTNPANLVDVHKRKQSSGLIFQVEKNENITVPVFDGSFLFKNGNSI